MGAPHNNPLLDTRQYDVEFRDGTLRAFTANQIATNMFAQVDEEGRRFMLMDEIIDHRKTEDAVSHQDAMFTDKNGRQHQRKTTKGWDLLISWKDGSTNWVKLKDVKEDFPTQVADYAKANKLEKEPAFQWWVPHVLQHRNRILSKVKTKYWQRTHKFGIKIPKNVKEALRIDDENGDTQWRDAFKKETQNKGWRLRHGTTTQVRYQRITKRLTVT